MFYLEGVETNLAGCATIQFIFALIYVRLFNVKLFPPTVLQCLGKKPCVHPVASVPWYTSVHKVVYWLVEAGSSAHRDPVGPLTGLIGPCFLHT